jgi:hypothetical protein
VRVGGFAWASASITGWDAAYSVCTRDGQTQNGTNFLGAVLFHRTNEFYSRNGAGSLSIGRFTNPANTIPVACIGATFYREGVFPTTDEDGYIQNIENIIAVDTSIVWCFTSSPSAPGGGTGFSEKTDAYWFIPITGPWGVELPAGVTLSDATFNAYVEDGYDDGQAFFVLFCESLAVNGDTLTTDDEGRPANHGLGYRYSVGAAPTFFGLWTEPLDVAKNINVSGTTNIRLTNLPDEATGSYSLLGDRTDTLRPAYIRATLNFPAPVADLVDTAFRFPGRWLVSGLCARTMKGTVAKVVRADMMGRTSSGPTRKGGGRNDHRRG